MKLADSLLHEDEPPEVLHFNYVNFQVKNGACVICFLALDGHADNVKDCSGCRVLGYCSHECQKKH